MKRIGLLLCCLYSWQVHAQLSGYTEDLKGLRDILQTTKSYKVQVRGDVLADYENLYQELTTHAADKDDRYQYFHQLSRLFFPLRDNHLAFYELVDWNQFRTRAGMDSFVASPACRDFPSVKLNIDSLKEVLQGKATDSVEGIYHYGPHYQVGVYSSGQKSYTGVVLSSAVPIWTPAQVAIHLFEQEPGRFKAIYAHPLAKAYILHPVEKYQYGALVNGKFYMSYHDGGYTKFPDRPDFINLSKGGIMFQFKTLSEEVQYMMVRTFQNSRFMRDWSSKFVDTVRQGLIAPNLIVDLRNNEGGADGESARYLKLLLNYSKKGKIWVLVNNGTLSQSELLLLELKKLKNVTVLGSPTHGMLAYGSNYGTRRKLPSGRFEVYITDMDNGKEALQYEDIGIRPDVFLEGNKDWIVETVKLLREGSGAEQKGQAVREVGE